MKKLKFVNNKEDEDIQRRILAIDRSRELCMVKLVKSVHYEIYKEYEVVLLKIKSSDQMVPVGDFMVMLKKWSFHQPKNIA